MKKLFTSGLKFVAFALIFYVLGILVFLFAVKKNLNYPVASYGHLLTRLQEAKVVRHPQVLAIGSSHVYRGYDTRIFDKAGISLFNLGSSAQTPIQGNLLLHEYIDRIQPATVLYDVSPAFFSSDGVESSLEVIANDTLTWQTVQMAFSVNNLKTYNALVFSWWQQLLVGKSHIRESPVHGPDTYVHGGFVESRMAYFRHLTYPKSAWAFKQIQWEKFDSSLAYLKQKGIGVILVQSPNTKACYNSHTNNQAFDSLIRLRNLPYYNFNDLPLDDSLDFYDAAHLNQRGVQRFDAEVIRKVFHK